MHVCTQWAHSCNLSWGVSWLFICDKCDWLIACLYVMVERWVHSWVRVLLWRICGGCGGRQAFCSQYGEWWKLTLPWASLHTWLLALAASGSFAQINSQIHPLSHSSWAGYVMWLLLILVHLVMEVLHICSVNQGPDLCTWGLEFAPLVKSSPNGVAQGGYHANVPYHTPNACSCPKYCMSNFAWLVWLQCLDSIHMTCRPLILPTCGCLICSQWTLFTHWLQDWDMEGHCYGWCVLSTNTMIKCTWYRFSSNKVSNIQFLHLKTLELTFRT